MLSAKEEVGLESLGVTKNGLLFPCFETNPEAGGIPDLVTVQGQDGLGDQEGLIAKAKVPMLAKDAIRAVVRGFAFEEGNRDMFKSTFTVFFVAPKILATARHNLFDGANKPYHSFVISMHPAETSWDDEPYVHDVEVIFQPDEPIPPPKTMPLNLDFAFLRVVGEKEYALPKTYLLPCMPTIEKDQDFFTIQFNGPVKDSWVERQKGYIKASGILGPDPKLTWTTLNVNNSMHVAAQSISLGRIIGVDKDHVVYASVCSRGASGAPGFYIPAPLKNTQVTTFCSVHSGGDYDRPYNRGLLTSNDTFMRAYAQFVVPHLTVEDKNKITDYLKSAH